MSLNRLAMQVGGWEKLRDCRDPEILPSWAAAQWRRGRALHTAFDAFTIEDPEYPPALRDLYDAPPVVFVEGSLEVFALRAQAIVGTRACTAYGASMARSLAGVVVDLGDCVVSGLARGIDGHAHRGALPGPTIAVLAHGLGHTAPMSHRSLRRQIVRSGGAMITTWPDDMEPKRWTFPVRNRWIAGLSERVIVVEASTKSGTTHTVDAAGDYSRTLYAVPGPVGAAASHGCNMMIGAGAQIITSIEAFQAELGGGRPRRGWLDALVGGEEIGVVASIRGGSVADLYAELHQLEAVGKVVRLPGNRYATA